MPRPAAALVAVALLCGCATSAQKMDRLASSSGLDVAALDGGRFLLRAYQQGLPKGRTTRLHVYLEGDGQPWIAGGTRVASDPHGEHHLAFELMRLDPSPSIYLKRPCYQALKDGSGNDVEPCHPLLWTHQRYSETVVGALEAALHSHLQSQPADEIVFIGYSGGGVLAMLLAPRFAEATTVITVGANLDVAGWADLHGYTPLIGSLDPARRPPLSAQIRQLHLVGELDTNVPPALVRRATESQPSAEVRAIKGFDHVCCWQDVWRRILGEVP